MKRLILFLLLPLLYSCKDNCKEIDCLSDDAFAFTIKSAESGEDLLFGGTAQLTQEDVEVYYLKNGAKQPSQFKFESGYVVVALSPEVTAYYITALDQTDAVRLAISSTGATACCPKTQKVEQLTVNDQPAPEDSWVLTLVR